MEMVEVMERFTLSSDENGSHMCGYLFLLWLSVCGGSIVILTLVSLRKLLGFDPAKAVEGGTAGWYMRALPVPVVARPSNAWLRGLFDFEILATCNSSLISLNLAYQWN
jgi:hypothetical protein